MNMLYIKLINGQVLLALLLLVIPSLAFAQSALSKYEALYTIRFLKYINWSTPQEQYVIGVVGSDSRILYELTKATKGRQVNGKDVIVKKIVSYDGLSEYSVVFVPESQTNKFSRIRDLLKGKSVLLVTEASHLAKEGADISFYTSADSKLKFNLNKKNIYARKMTVSSRLLSVATVL